jgi:8-oxo-dGTP diphosphatase
MFGDSFDGAKVAILRGNDVLVIRRDDKPDIPWPNCWDFPGGGRENDETPFETALRETREEVGLTLSEHRVFYHSQQPGPSGDTVHFFAVLWGDLSDTDVIFGREGQEWRFMPVHEFLEVANAIPSLQVRLRIALTTLS